MALSRKQTQQDTRRRLLDSAMTLAAEDGINAMSIRAICRAAGMTQGAFYANFSSKDDLLAVLMQLHLNREIDALQALTDADAARPMKEVISDLGTHFASLSQNRAWSLLSVELQVHALRDPNFAERYDANNADYLKALTGIIEALVARHKLRPALPVPQLAAGLHALWTGLIVQSRHDDVPGETLLLRIFSELVKTDPALPSRT